LGDGGQRAEGGGQLNSRTARPSTCRTGSGQLAGRVKRGWQLAAGSWQGTPELPNIFLLIESPNYRTIELSIAPG